jgi:hypothetical protein
VFRLLLITLICGLNFFLAADHFVAEKTGAAVLSGVQQATYRVSSGKIRLPVYVNNGFSQEWDSKAGNMLVQVHNTVLKSRTPARPVPEFPESCRSLEKELHSKEIVLMSQQVATVLNWLRLNIHYVRSGPVPGELSERSGSGGEEMQESRIPETLGEILLQRRADCVGLSLVTQHLFSLLGIQSRFVTGVAYQKDDPAVLQLKGAVLHRWIEVYYPDAGWVFSDPSGKVNYVEATYLVIAVWGVHPVVPAVHRLFGEKIELMAFYNGFRYSGILPGLDPRVGVRPDFRVSGK